MPRLLCKWPTYQSTAIHQTVQMSSNWLFLWKKIWSIKYLRSMSAVVVIRYCGRDLLAVFSSCSLVGVRSSSQMTLCSMPVLGCNRRGRDSSLKWIQCIWSNVVGWFNSPFGIGWEPRCTLYITLRRGILYNVLVTFQPICYGTSNVLFWLKLQMHQECFQSYHASLVKSHCSEITYEGNGLNNLVRFILCFLMLSFEKHIYLCRCVLFSSG